MSSALRLEACPRMELTRAYSARVEGGGGLVHDQQRRGGSLPITVSARPISTLTSTSAGRQALG